MSAWLRRWWRRVAIGAVVVLGVFGAEFTYDRFFREEPAPYFASAEDHFLFGSVGTEGGNGVPYWLWLVLPRVFPDLLPGPEGYASLGFVAKDGHDLPVGLSKATVGFSRVSINCAMCHAASYRLRPDDPPTIVTAGPSHQTSPQDYFRFLFAAASDPRFSSSTLLAEIGKNTRLSRLDRLLYRFAIIPATRRQLRQVRTREDGWMRTRPDWGKGRIDPFNPVKFGFLKQPFDQTVGNSDMVPVWNLGAHQGQAMHWDGLNTSLQEVVISSALGDGAPMAWVDRDMARWETPDPRNRSSLRRIADYMSAVKAPAYPLPLDVALASAGEVVYAATCAGCHAPESQRVGTRVGTIIPLGEVGTDRHRLDMWTPDAANAYNAYGTGHAWKFSGFRSTTGYVAVPHDGLWLRAPYLHNGSVPTLADLLEPSANRPKQFWRGFDLFDAVKVGFVSSGAEAQRAGTRYDTSRPGNSNAGHEFGTTLPPNSKRALLEYLKTR
jgi:hypothetical protein